MIALLVGCGQDPPPTPEACAATSSVVGTQAPPPVMELLGETASTNLGYRVAIADLAETEGGEVAASAPMGGGGHSPRVARVLVAPGSGRRRSGVVARSWLEPDLYSTFGYYLSTFDVTGDGRADLLFGSPSASPDGDGGAGTVHVMSSPIPPRLEVWAAHAIVLGESAGGQVGPVVDLGDLDLDGTREVGVGRLGFSMPWWEVPPAVIAVPYADLLGEVVFEDYPVLFDGPGYAEVSAVDSTGDGVVDLMITGKVPDQTFYAVPEPDRSFYTFPGPLELDGAYGVDDAVGVVTALLGVLLATAAGDLDQDGLDDVLLSSPLEPTGAGDRAGYVAVLPGAPIPQVVALQDLGTFLEGDVAFATVGTGLLGPGDLDGDGADDLVIGIPGDNHFGADQVGEALVFLGPVDGRLERSDAAVVLTNGRSFSQFGWSLASGDLDGDERPDLAVGAPFDSSCEPGGGAVYAWRAIDLF